MIDGYEDFTSEQLQVLERFVTSTKKSIFALRNLPEVIKGALFSRYSRSSLGLRSLLLKEFINNSEETGFDQISGVAGSDALEPGQQLTAIKKAQNFYDRILDGYGDDSIGELGGAHLAVENISMLAAKVIEDSRIGGSPLEKSTRYIYFDQKVKGEYLFYREPVLMTSAYRTEYINVCNMLFDTYAKLIPPLTSFMEARFAKGPETSKAVYTAAIRAKVLDCLRGLLPAATLTNMGLYGNGRFFEYLIHKLLCHNLTEIQHIGTQSYEELFKILPSFVRRADPGHKTHVAYAQFVEAMQTELKRVAKEHTPPFECRTEPWVRLISWDPAAVEKVAAALLFAESSSGLDELEKLVTSLPEEEREKILEAGASSRESRRHKSPRALEVAHYTFEIMADFGSYRDLHRHRILTQERQLLTCDHGYYIPPELQESNLDAEYRQAMVRAKILYDAIAKELPEEAQYVVPMAYHVRWYFGINLRSLQWLCELRSGAAGHPSYRLIAQKLAMELFRVHPQFRRFFKFVDFDGYDLGRLGQEQRQEQKKLEVGSL